MGRILSDTSALSGTGSNNGNVLAGIVSATKIVPAGYMGEFGSGLWRIFTESSPFTVPEGVTSIRVRVVGAGGYSPPGGGGGGGGGYSHGVFSVTPGTTYAVTVAPEAHSGPGGTSSFGALISATGGGVGLAAAPYTGGAGGIGVGGDFQATGGTGGKGYTGTKQGGGGGAGSQLGNGGNGGNAYSTSETGAGGGIVGHASSPTYGSSCGGSPFGNACGYNPGPDISGGIPGDSVFNGAVNSADAVIRFPFDGFTGGGGKFRGGSNGGNGGIGGGGGGGAATGVGGIGGGSAGGGGGQYVTNPSYGAGGLVIVEW